MSKLWSDLVQQLDPYVPGEQPKVSNLIKLNTNENPYPPSPKVQAVLSGFDENSLRLYPDPNSQSLKQALAKQFSVNESQVFVGNGSDEVLAHAFVAFFKKDKPLLFPDISYSFYPVYCNLFDIDFEKIALDKSFSIQTKDYKKDCGGIIFPNPNAPTGKYLALDTVKTLAKEHSTVVVIVDEAYIDFGGDSAVALIDECPNIVIIQTFSKSRSLAGIRLGYAIAQPDLIDGLERVKNSFNSYPINRLSEAAALASLNDQAYFESCRERVIATRENTVEALEALGFDILDSKANFVFAKPDLSKGVDSKTIFIALRERNIIVRYFDKPRISEYLRITIGTEDEMHTLIKALQEILA